MQIAGTPIQPELAALLERFRFDRVPFEELRARLVAAGPDLEALHRISEPIEVPADDVAQPLPAAGTPARKRATALGRDLIERGEVAAVVLAGGMATRFGSQVKALAPVLDGCDLTFLDLKLADLTRYGVKTTLMTSFATHDALADAVRGSGVELAPQLVSLRLQADGSLYIGDDGAPSPYAPGHGDLADALELSGAFERYRQNGVRTLFVCNVDNVGATLDPALVGLHRSLGGAVTAELVSKRPGDAGGLPVRRADGSLAIAEAFRVPEGFPHERFPLFNTNTLWIDVDALEQPAAYTWSVARKSVDGREAIQLERLIGELTWWHPSRYVHVPRDGAESRFVPVKDTDDLAAAQEQIRAICRERLALDV
ncbi:MAG TPA: UTP--glucose-1-phosphate uridylyltransferase [Gaiellales bacterium]|jgi:UTP--glucose-1-phosphate uridylyltransferase|nr:UTP--glucose-1-phosphate uridylyltransferase [Gaiellales bacterium]